MKKVLLRDRSIGPAVEWHSLARQCKLMIGIPCLSFELIRNLQVKLLVAMEGV